MSKIPSGGSHGQNGQLPAVITQEQLDFVRTFNKGLSTAASKPRQSHHGHGRRPTRAITRGRISADNTSGLLRGNVSSVSRSGSGLSRGVTRQYAVGPLIPSKSFDTCKMASASEFITPSGLQHNMTVLDNPTLTLTPNFIHQQEQAQIYNPSLQGSAAPSSPLGSPDMNRKMPISSDQSSSSAAHNEPRTIMDLPSDMDVDMETPRIARSCWMMRVGKLCMMEFLIPTPAAFSIPITPRELALGVSFSASSPDPSLLPHTSTFPISSTEQVPQKAAPASVKSDRLLVSAALTTKSSRPVQYLKDSRWAQ